jgi:Tripartite tricarboxylate transporter TctB family
VKIKSQKDFFSGLMFTVVGGSFALGASHYSLGSGARMGPGYFPLLLGIVLALLGVAVIVKSFTSGGADGDKIGKWAWKPLAYIIGANVLFGVMIGGLPSIGLPSMGMIAGIYALVIVASLAGEKFSLKEALILSTILSVGSYLAFIKLLNQQFPLWPAFITG